MSTPLTWTKIGPTAFVAESGARTYLIARGSATPEVYRWNLYLTHAEMERDDNGETALLCQGWGCDVQAAKDLARLVHDAPVGDDGSAQLEFVRGQQRRQLAETCR